MKKILTILVLITAIVSAQDDSVKIYKSGLYLGVSGIYPHYMTITDKTIATHKNFGFGFHVGYDISEHFGFRLSTNYVLMGSFWYENGKEQDNFVNMGTVNIDALYNILPCEIVSPYVIAGYGFTWFKSSNPYLGPNKDRDWIKEAYTGNQFEMGIGAEFKFWDDIHIKAEVDYVTATNNKIDGNEHKNGVKGLLYSNGDTYMNLKLGASWYFWRGEKSKICEPFSIREVITEIPVEKIVIDTVYIDKIIERAIVKRESFVLENVRFRFDKDVLTAQAEIILQNVARVLNKYPEENIEILGHTDNWGSDEYNLNLSHRRAISVKKYLVLQGVASTRLFTAGCGERMPIADNETAEGRAINRRIEFSLYDGQSRKCLEFEDSEIMKGQVPQKFKNEEQKAFAASFQAGDQLSYTNIQFEVNSDIITESSKKTLDNVVHVLKKLPDQKLEIQGHTDSDGDGAYNQDLSERRAASVKNYLASNGISEDRLTTTGYGETNPVTSNNTSDGKTKNRRIEFLPIK